MKTCLFLLIIGGPSIFAASCSKELKYSKEELFSMARQADPTITFVLPKSINDGISCVDYTGGCVTGHTVRIKGLDLIAVEFLNEESARNAAKKVRGFYVRNWLFDDVRGEPILERFVQEVLKAKKP